MKGTYRRGYGVNNGEGNNGKSYLFFRTKFYGSILFFLAHISIHSIGERSFPVSLTIQNLLLLHQR